MDNYKFKNYMEYAAWKFMMISLAASLFLPSLVYFSTADLFDSFETQNEPHMNFENFDVKLEILDQNFLARYRNGNGQK